MPATQVRLIRLNVAGLRFCQRLTLRRRQFDLQLVNDVAGNFVLNLKNIFEVAVIPLGPQLVTVACVDELGADAYAMTASTHASLQKCADVEQLTDLSDPEQFPLQRERRSARSDLECGNPCQRVENVLGDSVREVFIVRTGTHVSEGHYADRRLVGSDARMFNCTLSGQIAHEILGAAVTLFRIASQHFTGDAVQPRRAVFANAGGCGSGFGESLDEAVFASEWWLPGQHFI